MFDRIAMLSVHTSPLASLGGKKTGGMNVYVREIAREFAARGVGVDIFTRRTDNDQPYVDESLGAAVRVIHVKAGPVAPLNPDEIYPYLSQFAASVIAYATKNNVVYPVIYSHYWLSGWVANKLREVWGVPFVQMFHTLGEMKKRIGAGEANLPDVRIATETQIVQWADRLIAATQAEQAQLLWLYRADRRKIDIIPPGVDPDRFSPLSQADARRALGFDANKSLFLFVGRIEPLKAVDTIVQAIDLIQRGCAAMLPSLQVAIIGGNPDDNADQELAHLKSLVERYGLSDTIRFLGAKSHQQLPAYYAAATAVIVPSDYESFGMVALEAMAMGTPVIASEVGGLAFLVKDGETGFHIPVRDPRSLAKHMITLSAKPAIRDMLGNNAVAVAQQYLWSRIADRLLETFAAVIRARQSNRRKR